MNRQFVKDTVDALTKSVGVNRSRVSQALALAIGYALNVPSEGVASPDEYFAQNYGWKVKRFVSEFNERYLIEVQTVIDGAQEIWLGRYRQLFIHSESEIKMMLEGHSPAWRFLSGVDQPLEDSALIANAAYLLYPRISPILLDMNAQGN